MFSGHVFSNQGSGTAVTAGKVYSHSTSERFVEIKSHKGGTYAMTYVLDADLRKVEQADPTLKRMPFRLSLVKICNLAPVSHITGRTTNDASF